MRLQWPGRGHVTEGGRKVVMADPRGFRRYAARHDGKGEVDIIILPAQHLQDGQVRRYYRGVVIPDICRTAVGEADPRDYERYHDEIAFLFLRIADDPETGERRRRSTADYDLSDQEMRAFVNQVITWAETSLVDCEIRDSREVDIDRVYDPGWP